MKNKNKRRSSKSRSSSSSKSSRRRSSSTVKSTVLMEGILKTHRDGYGFVLSEKIGQPDVFIPARMMEGAMNGDRVLALVQANARDGRLEGGVQKILVRSVQTLVGELKQEGRKYYAVTGQGAGLKRFLIPREFLNEAKVGQSVGIKVLEHPQGDQLGTAKVLQVFAKRGTERTEVDVIILKHQLPTEFPEAAVEEALSFEHGKELDDVPGRVDLRSLGFVTIDGETARDFDDAIYVEREGKNHRLWVAIADVSHYVRPGTPVDQEAFARGTSVYFPERCIPMLPEALSNNLCSLVPQQDRLTFTAELLINAQGKVTDAKFYKSVICSSARLTYRQVAQALLEDKPDSLPSIKVYKMLQEALKLSRLLGKVRSERGSIDFDIPEPEVIMGLEEDDIKTIVKAQRNEAHLLIEQFMIAANEAVARFFEEKKVTGVFRVHDAPDPAKVEALHMLLHNLGFNIAFPKETPPKFFAGILAGIKGHAEEQLIQHILLRTMRQAVYSTENLGHFGLASKSYTHFTSPIRRYPDLAVHRILTEILYAKKSRRDDEATATHLSLVASHSSARERVAMEAEWEVRDLKVAMFMKKYVGETFSGVVARITKFGLFVELLDYFVQGLILLEDLRDDYYIFDDKRYRLRGRRSNRVFKIGSEMKVTVAKVDIENRQVFFVPAE